MNNKFLDKVCGQILSETRIIDNKVYTPFFSLPSLSPFLFLPPFSLSLTSHCKEVYSLNEQEIDYVWGKYKKGVTALMEDKELIHQEKG